MPKRKKEIQVVKAPIKEDIREWVKLETTQWFLNRIAFHLNSIDTVRDITLENIDEALARKMAIEVIEDTLADIWQEGDLALLQRKLAEEEDSIIKRLKSIKEEY
jgi:hypothetical protein